MTIPDPGQRNLRHTQNFLKSRRLVEDLLRRSSIGPADLVYEIGPGRGRITACLVARCRRVVAVEADPCLAALLRRRFANEPRLALHAADCRQFPLPAEPYKVFASIPFDVTTAIIARLTGGPRTPEDLYLIVQREAAERFLGSPRETLASVLLKPWFEPTIVHRFARDDFDPAPRVDVVMLRLRKRGPPLIAAQMALPYRDFVVAGFTGSRPTASGLRLGPFGKLPPQQMRALGIAAAHGPSAITFEQWLALFAHYRRVGDPQAWSAITGSERRWREQHAARRPTARRARRLPRPLSPAGR
jgi:23S rRNA (adenine-N6)-dimethyltransferase